MDRGLLPGVGDGVGLARRPRLAWPRGAGRSRAPGTAAAATARGCGVVAGSASGSFAERRLEVRQRREPVPGAVDRLVELLARRGGSAGRQAVESRDPARRSRWSRSAGRIAPSVRTVVNGSLPPGLHRRGPQGLRQEDVDAQHVGRQLRLDPLADALAGAPPGGRGGGPRAAPRRVAAPRRPDEGAMLVIPSTTLRTKSAACSGGTFASGSASSRPAAWSSSSHSAFCGEPAKARTWQSSASRARLRRPPLRVRMW